MSTKAIIILSIIFIPIAIMIVYYTVRFIVDLFYFFGLHNLPLIPGGLIASHSFKQHVSMPNIYCSLAVTVLSIVLAVLVWKFIVKNVYDFIDIKVSCWFRKTWLGRLINNRPSKMIYLQTHGHIINSDEDEVSQRVNVSTSILNNAEEQNPSSYNIMDYML